MPDLVERLAEAHRTEATAAARRGEEVEVESLDDDAALTDAELAAIKVARAEARARAALAAEELTRDLPPGYRLRPTGQGEGVVLEQLVSARGGWRDVGRYPDAAQARLAAPGHQRTACDPARLRATLPRR